MLLSRFRNLCENIIPSRLSNWLNIFDTSCLSNDIRSLLIFVRFLEMVSRLEREIFITSYSLSSSTWMISLPSPLEPPIMTYIGLRQHWLKDFVLRESLAYQFGFNLFIILPSKYYYYGFIIWF